MGENFEFTLWAIAFTASVLAIVIAMRLPKLARDDRGDTGPAIIAFGRAYPYEAIRDVVATVDEQTYFMRLFDGKAGCVQNGRRYMTCRLLKPGAAVVTPTTEPKAIHIEFSGNGLESGEFVFRSEERAAEVSLWLLGNLAVQSDILSDGNADNTRD